MILSCFLSFSLFTLFLKFSFIEPLLHLWNGADLIMVDDFLMFTWIQVVCILLSNFVPLFIFCLYVKLIYNFLCLVLCGFESRKLGPHKMYWAMHLLFLFCRIIWGDWHLIFFEIIIEFYTVWLFFLDWENFNDSLYSSRCYLSFNLLSDLVLTLVCGMY